MAILREKPYPGMNFVVDLGTGETDGLEAGLSEVVFPEARVHVLGTEPFLETLEIAFDRLDME